MKFASFPVSLLAVLVSYQWHSFGAYGATIEAASSPDLEADKEEIFLPLNALRGNRNLASVVKWKIVNYSSSIFFPKPLV